MVLVGTIKHFEGNYLAILSGIAYNLNCWLFIGMENKLIYFKEVAL